MTQFAAKGTLLKKGDGASPEVFNTVAQVRDISGPDTTLETPDVTHHSSPEGHREFVGALIDGGEVTLELLFDPSDPTHDAQTGLLKEQKDRTKKNYQILFPDSSTATFVALVSNTAPAAPIDDALTKAVTLKISGVITWA